MAKTRTTCRTQTLHYPSHWMTPEELLTFVEMPPFSRRWEELGLEDEDLQCLQALIMTNPTAGQVVKGTGGLRKLRCGRRDAAKGKSAGYRLCYVYFEEFGTVAMVLIYPKNEQDNIPANQKNAIRRLIERIHQRLASRPYRLGPAPQREEKK